MLHTLINQGGRNTGAVPSYEGISMATISVIKSGHIRVQYRKKNLKLISRTFTSRQEAEAYADRLDFEFKKITEAEKVILP